MRLTLVVISTPTLSRRRRIDGMALLRDHRSDAVVLPKAEGIESVLGLVERLSEPLPVLPRHRGACGSVRIL